MLKAISVEIAAVQQEATQGLDPQILDGVRQALKCFRRNLQKADPAESKTSAVASVNND